MKLARLGALGAGVPVAIDGDRTFDLRPVPADLVEVEIEGLGRQRQEVVGA